MHGNHPCNATAPLNLACRLNEEDYFQYPFAHAAVTAFPYLTLGKEEKGLQNEESWQHRVLAPNQIRSVGMSEEDTKPSEMAQDPLQGSIGIWFYISFKEKKR